MKLLYLQMVYKELVEYENHQFVIDQNPWIKIVTVQNIQEVNLLKESLDVGEAEAIVLAKELHARLFIIDEKKGRKIAVEYGLPIIGLLGVLARGKLHGIIPELKPLLDRLIEDIGFRVSEKLYDIILNEVGEA